MSNTPDYLFEDPPINSQKYVCISVLTPKNFKEQTTMHTLKVRGSYDSYEEAKKRADFLRNIDPNVNVYVGEVGKWLPFEDDPEKAKDHDYQNKRLNEMMKGYLENQEKAKEFHEQRKNEMVMRSLKENEEKEKRRNNRIERRAKGEQVDDDAEEAAFLLKEKEGITVSDANITKNDTGEETNVNKREEISEKLPEKLLVPKEDLIKEKEKEMKQKEKVIQDEKAELNKTQEEYNKYQQKTEKVRKELEEAKRIYESMLAAGMKGK